MKKEIIAFSCIVWALAAISSARPAKAYLAIPLQDVTKITVTGKYREVPPSAFCGHTFLYEQLMAIPGAGLVWVPVDIRYPKGNKNLSRVGVPCDLNGGNIYIYAWDDCGC